MYAAKHTATLLLLLCAASASQSTHAQAPQSFDGRWNVVLDCADTGSGTSLVRGYTLSFAVNIVGGRMDGRFDEPTPPAFVRFVGTVTLEGALAINANGLTGSPVSTIGKLRPGSPYAYTLKGKLDATQGKADRVESRPCTARFVRVP
jgi:hypothetical protein